MNKGPGEQQKAMDSASPVFWLRGLYRDDKSIPAIVKQRIAKLYEKQPRYGVSDDASLHQAMRLTCLINLARIDHALAQVGPLHRSYLSLSKSAATWTLLLAKFNKANKNGDGESKPKRKVPTAALIPDQDDDHDLEDGDAESASE